MRFKWRRHFAVMAFAMGSMLPFAGCSSQQQQATDEVAAEGQQGGGDEEQGGQQEASAEGQAGDETAAADGAPTNGASDATGGGENVASNNAATSAEGSADGDLQEIITEMNGSGQNQAAAGSAPLDAASAPEAATAEAAPTGAASAAPTAAPEAAAAAAAAAAAPAVAGMPEQGSKMAYVVEAGDTLAKIAMKIYGDQKRWKDIANLSGMDNPNHIYPGDMVYYSLDDSSKNFASAYESIKRAKEVVREGDTLAAISQRVYGTSKAWRHIWRQNDKIDNPDVLSAGMTIYYVEKGAVKTALNKLNGLDFAKVLEGSKTSAAKVVKSVKVMSKVSTIVPTTSV